MTSFDRFAWLCSRWAPFGFGLAVAAVVASLVLRGGSLPGLQALPLVAIGAGMSGLVAHGVLAYHVASATFLTSDERRTLMRALHASGGYARWRATLQGEIPS